MGLAHLEQGLPPFGSDSRPSNENPLSRFRKGISDREKADFCTQLAVMLQARISLTRALEVLVRQASKPSLRRVLAQVAADVSKGLAFDAALARQPVVFDRLFIVTAEVGQESGRLPEVLTHLAAHLEKMNGLRRKFTQAMAYPALVMTVAFLAVTFLLVFIVPTFAEMFRSFQIDLPVATKVILALSQGCVRFGPFVLAGIVAAGVLSRQSLRKPATKTAMESAMFRLPLVGDVLLKTHVARFCRTMGTLLQAQVTLVEALGVAQRIATNERIRTQIGLILRRVRQGNAIADPLGDSDLFPPMVVQMVAVGEETSELDAMLLRVADYYEQEIDARVETLSSIMEPILVVFLGIVVAAILISMYMPMFDLVNVVGG